MQIAILTCRKTIVGIQQSAPQAHLSLGSIGRYPCQPIASGVLPVCPLERAEQDITYWDKSIVAGFPVVVCL